MKDRESKQQLSNTYLNKTASILEVNKSAGIDYPILTLNLRDNIPLIDRTTMKPNGGGIRSVFIGSYNGLSLRAPIVMKLPEGIEEKLFAFKQPGYTIETQYCLQKVLKNDAGGDTYYSVRPHFVMFSPEEMKAATVPNDKNEETFITKKVDVSLLDEGSQAIKFLQAVHDDKHQFLRYDESKGGNSSLILHGDKVSPNNLNLKDIDNPGYFTSIVTNHTEKKTVITIHRIVDSDTATAIENKIKSLPKDFPITLAAIPDLFDEFKIPELNKIKEACVELAQEKVLQQAKEAKDAQDAKNAAEAKAIKDVEEAKAALENQTKVNLLKEKSAEYLRHLDPKWQPDMQDSLSEQNDEKEDIKLLSSNANVNVDKLSAGELLQLKKKIVNDMYNALVTNKNPSIRLDHVRDIIKAPNNKEILAKNRDSAGMIFLKVLASIFTFLIAAFKLFTVRGEKLHRNTTEILDARSSKKHKT
jgi:hypothetical protein